MSFLCSYLQPHRIRPVHRIAVHIRIQIHPVLIIIL
jgi:hypothetical protein